MPYKSGGHATAEVRCSMQAVAGPLRPAFAALVTQQAGGSGSAGHGDAVTEYEFMKIII